MKHGQWLPWVAKHLPFTDRTARNYIQAYENRERLKLESVSDLGSAYRLLREPKADTITTEKPAESEALKFTCDSCGAGFDDDSEAVTLYECGDCGEKFTQETSANGNHSCPSCNKFGGKASDLGCPECNEGELESNQQPPKEISPEKNALKPFTPTPPAKATKDDKRAAWQMSKEQAAEHRRDDDKGEPMLLAKRGWKKMTKKERAEFWTWILNHGEKHRMGTFLQTCKLTRMLIATVPHSLLCVQPGIEAVRQLLNDFVRLTPFTCDVEKCDKDANRYVALCANHKKAVLKVIGKKPKGEVCQA